MRTATVKESIEVIRQYVGKEVTVRNGDTVEMLRVIGYSDSKAEGMRILTVILEDNNGLWTITKDVADTEAGDEVYALFIDKDIKARFENTFNIDEFKDLTSIDYVG